MNGLETVYTTPESRHRLATYLVQQGDPSKLAWNHIELTEVFRSDNFLLRVKLFNEFILQPLLLVLFWSCFFVAPEILWSLGLDTTVSLWNIVTWVVSGGQTLVRWGLLLVSFRDYLDVSSKVWFWKVLTHQLGGPWITGPPRYETLLYADAVARITKTLLD